MRSQRALLALNWMFLVSLLSGCKEESPSEPVVQSVLVQPAQAWMGEGSVVYSGEVRARHEADLAFRVPGRLLSRSVEVGAVVKPGVGLAQLDPTDLRLNAAAMQSQVEAAESDLALAKAEMDRYAALTKEKFVSQALYDAKVTAYKAADARLRQARAQASVSGNQAGYAVLSDALGGVVTAVFADAGQVVAAGQPVLRVARPGEMEVLVNVPENRLAQVKSAKGFQIRLWSDSGTVLRGELRELAPMADPVTRTYAARIRLLDVDSGVHLGMTAKVALPGGLSEMALVSVPLAAVVDHGSGPEVWVPENGKVQARKVDVAEFRENEALLTSGVKPGEPVVAVGAHKLVSGQAVQSVPLQAVAH